MFNSDAETLEGLVRGTARRHGLDPILVAGVILQESSGEPASSRLEQSFHARRLASRTREELAGYVPPPPGPPSLDDEKQWRATSFGLMHILGETARVLGFRHDYLHVLQFPEVSLEWGARVLVRCFGDRERDTELSIAATLLRYNGGADPAYPRKVLRRIANGAAAEYLEAIGAVRYIPLYDPVNPRRVWWAPGRGTADPL